MAAPVAAAIRVMRTAIFRVSKTRVQSRFSGHGFVEDTNQVPFHGRRVMARAARAVAKRSLRGVVKPSEWMMNTPGIDRS